MNDNGLPRWWKKIPLRQRIGIIYGRGLPKRAREESGQVDVYGSNGVVGRHTSAVTSGPTIIIGRKGSVGAIHYSSEPCWPIDTTFYIDTFPDDIDAYYLSLFLQSQDLASLNIHAAIPGIRRDDLLELPIPIPYPDDPPRSLAEQRRIVARIEAIFTELRECQRLNDAIRADTDRVMDSFVIEIFRGIQTERWKSTSIGALMIGKPQYGTSQKADSDEYGGLPVLRMGNIQNGKLDLTNLKYVELSDKDQKKYKLQHGDIVFNRTNSAELVGKTAVYNSDQTMVFASYLIRFQVDLDHVNPYFLNYYINSSLGKKYIQSQFVRAVGQVNVNAQKLKAMPILLPKSKYEQDDIVDHLRATESVIADIQQTQANDAKNFQEMEQAVLNQAFRGEL